MRLQQDTREFCHPLNFIPASSLLLICLLAIVYFNHFQSHLGKKSHSSYSYIMWMLLYVK